MEDDGKDLLLDEDNKINDNDDMEDMLLSDDVDEFEGEKLDNKQLLNAML